MQNRVFAIAIAVAVIGINDAQAQHTPNRDVVYKEVTEIDFRGLDVRADVDRPSIRLVEERPGLKFVPMLRVRADFDDEMNTTVDEVR